MRSVEDKNCYSHGLSKEISSNSGDSFEFRKGNGTGRTSHHRMALGKPTPSKWDDAQKWLVGLSRGGEKHQSKTAPRNSNADDRRLIAPVPQKEQDYLSGEDEGGEDDCPGSATETKNVDYDESIWRINKEESTTVVRSIYVRDMGTEMTPIGSLEPSRTATPIRGATVATRSAIPPGSSTSSRCQNGVAVEGYQTGVTLVESQEEPNPSGRGSGTTHQCGESNVCEKKPEKTSEQARKVNPLDTRATAWDEAERAKYMARYKREEVKIQGWEIHEKRKAEMEMRRTEVKAERLKARSQERLANKLAATTRIAEEKRANAEAKLNEKAVKTSETADYIRNTGHLPSTSFFKFPSLCW